MIQIIENPNDQRRQEAINAFAKNFYSGYTKGRVGKAIQESTEKGKIDIGELIKRGASPEEAMEFAKQFEDREYRKKDFGLREKDYGLKERALENDLRKSKRQQDFYNSIFSPNEQNYSEQEMPHEQTTEEYSTQNNRSPGVPNKKENSGFNPKNLSDQQIAAISTFDPNLAKILQQQKMQGKENFNEERKYHTEQIKDYEKGIGELRAKLPYKETASRIIHDAIVNEESPTWDYIAQRLRAPFLQSLEGAALQSGVKELLLSNIGRAGSKPNMWLEQQMQGATAELGKKKWANLAVHAGTELEVKMERKKLEIHDQLADMYEKELGYIPKNIDREVDKKLKPLWDKEDDILSYKVQKFREKDQGEGELKKIKQVPEGTPLTVDKARVLMEKYKDEKIAQKIAKKLGYKIPSSEVYEANHGDF